VNPVPRHVIEVHTYTHTCPGDPQVHVVETWRALVETIHTPCVNPQPIQSTRGVVYVDCGRLVRSDLRCEACTVVIDVSYASTTHLGYEGSSHDRPAGVHVPPRTGRTASRKRGTTHRLLPRAVR
jgi:hypothetical protein